MNNFFSQIMALCIVVVIIFLAFSDYEAKSVQTIKTYSLNSSDELVEDLVKDLYGGVEFNVVSENGKSFAKRFYCSNLCIDSCKDGKVKILSDIKANDPKDPILLWLLESESLKVTKELVLNGAIYREAEGENINFRMLINPENDRIFAAVIDIKYIDE